MLLVEQSIKRSIKKDYMREKIYNELLKNKNTYISGEVLSQKLGISRAAISKHMIALKADGAVIDSKKNNGHKLVSSPDRLKKQYVLCGSSNRISTYKWFETIGSTNDELKKVADSLDEISIYVSEEQTSGRGRRGRYWESQKYNGMYLSFLLKPKITIEQAFQITCVVSLALIDTINGMLNLNAKIKWPNDIIIGKRKVCGTLTELSSDFDGVNYMVCGIGINANQSSSDFPNDILDKATSLFIESGKKIDRTVFLSLLIDNIISCYDEFKANGLDNIINYYKKHSVVLNKEVFIINGKSKTKGIVTDINEKGELLLQTDEGIEKIFTGEVSLRGVNGYV